MDNNLILMKAFFSILFYLSVLLCKGQKHNPYQNPVILNHYSVPELQSLQASDTVKYNSIRYYYTSSFIFEPYACNSCNPIAISDFDVSQYEYLRQKSKRYVRHFSKYGFKLTLLSINELTYKLPIHLTK
ncbi:MAG: hypothetical protein K0S53_2982 [Bacteroidetes bacterium]|nr:hypothetical protein [Bacteroidota bacterium]MDF2453429.1 hypothetical protein [Bacteroidota bacterium]